MQSAVEPGRAARVRWLRPRGLLVTLLAVLGLVWLCGLRTVRIPSDSMMPTLIAGDLVLVNPLAYALQLPFTSRTLLTLGSPQRGDVVVFRHPLKPSVLYVKRVVGVPGDRVEVVNDRFVINGTPVPFDFTGPYSDGCYTDLQRGSEQLGAHRHDVLLCPVPLQVTPVAPPACRRRGVRGYLCSQDPDAALEFQSVRAPLQVVPAGQYFVVGDNRDNSEDSRDWGFLPVNDVVGKAALIWLSWDPARSGGPGWDRAFKAVQ
jgi:signal peptidase I